MGLFKRKDAATAVADPSPVQAQPGRARGRDRTAHRGRTVRRPTRTRSAGCCACGTSSASSGSTRATRPGSPLPDEAALPSGGGLPEIAAADLTPGLLRAGILRDGCVLVRGLVDRDAARRARRADRSRLRRARRGRRRRLVACGPLRGVRAGVALRGHLRPAVDQAGRRRARRRLAAAHVRDARAVRRRRAAGARGRLPRRAPRCSPSTRPPCARRSRPSAAPGTRTARSWATSRRSTCGCRSRAAATWRPASTSSRAGSTTS